MTDPAQPMSASDTDTRTPGLLVTATDTEVGKTVVTCAILRSLRQSAMPDAAGFKPFASGCSIENGQLVNDDALAIKAACGHSFSLDEINPVRYQLPIAPGVAAEDANESVDLGWQRMLDAHAHLASSADCVVVEGVGGLLAPIDQSRTALDMATTLRYPVIVVARSTLGTLNHTAMTVRILREAGCDVAGVVMNGFDTDAVVDDPSIATNKRWIEKLTGAKVLAVLPRVDASEIDLTSGRLPDAILKPIQNIDWRNIVNPPACR